MHDDEPALSTASCLIESCSDGVLWLRLNRPAALNAIDRTLGELLIGAVDRARRDDDVRAIVLIGTGRAFCAGDDIAGLEAFLRGETANERSAVDQHDGTALYLRLAQAMILCPKPVVAAVNGLAFGAGTEVLCAADMRCMAKSARVGSSLVNIAEVGNAALLGAVVGSSRAFEIFLSGRAVASDEALAIGLASYVFEDDEFEREVEALARRLAEGPTKVIALQKKLRNACEGRSVLERIGLQDEAHRVCYLEIEDAKEGAAAFLEKRPAQFSGR